MLSFLGEGGATTMSRRKVTREKIAAMIVAQTNADAKEKIEGIEIIPMYSDGHAPNWSAGTYWPVATAGGLTELTLQRVVAELQEEFDISD
jgi:hypothetical protein